MYKVEVNLWTENAWRGNCSQYYVRGIFGRNICLTGRDNAKVYTDYKKAEKASDCVKRKYPHSVVYIIPINEYIG